MMSRTARRGERMGIWMDGIKANANGLQRKVASEFGTGHLPASGELFRRVYPMLVYPIPDWTVNGTVCSRVSHETLPI